MSVLNFVRYYQSYYHVKEKEIYYKGRVLNVKKVYK